MQNQHERGIALVLALFLTSILSVLAASLMFLSQTETYASMNYKMMSQARYAGEAAIQKASNFLLDSTQYTMPGSVTDPLVPNYGAEYDTTKSPVTCLSGCTTINGPIVLSADPAVPSNYPIATVITAFNALFSGSGGTLTADSATLTYNASAKLMSMQKFETYGGGDSVVQTWEITANGGVSGPRNATVQVVATIETPKVAANSYAAFATANTCDAMYFHGNVSIDSYDSAVSTPGGSSHTMSGGDLGTNGNLHIQGSVEVGGNLYTPRTGTGSCAAGAVDGLTEGGSAAIDGSMVQLPKAVSYPLPTFSVIPPTTKVTLDSTELAKPAATVCSDLGLVSGTNCSLDSASHSAPWTIVNVTGGGADVTLPTVNVSGGYTLKLTGSHSPAQVVNMNGMIGSGSVEVGGNQANNDAVVLKISGKCYTGDTCSDGINADAPFDLSTIDWKQSTSNSVNYDASTLQIMYGGTATISMKGGNSQSAATLYAPNAAFSLQGTQDWYGSVLAKTVTNGGNASIHYDRRLSHDFYVKGQPMASSFTWSRY